MSYLSENKKEKESLTYFLYARKSTESEDRQIQSIDDQVDFMKKMASDLNLKIVDIITEAKSAKQPGGRPAFNAMIERIKAGEASSILTWKIDRLSRNPIDSATIQWLLQEDVLKSIHTPGRQFLPGDNAIIFSVESSMANQYIRDLSKNVTRGMQSKAQRGWFPGLAPMGYINKRHSLKGVSYIAKDPKRFDLVRRAWDYMLNSKATVPEICDLMNNEWGYKGRTWRKASNKLSVGSLYKVFTNPFYCGLIKYKDTMYKGKHIPMVTIKEYDRAQELLGRNGKPKATDHECPFTGLMRCGECGGVISATTARRRPKSGGVITYVYYYCVNAGKKRNCDCSQKAYTTAKSLEQQFTDHIRTLSIHPALASLAIDMLDGDEKRSQLERERLARKYDVRFAELKQQKTNLNRLSILGRIDEDDHGEELVRIDLQIDELKKAVNGSQASSAPKDMKLRRLLELSIHAEDLFKTGTFKEKKMVLREFCSNFTLQDKNVAIQSPFWLSAAELLHTSIEEKNSLFESLKYGFVERSNDHYDELVRRMWTWIKFVRKNIDKINRRW